MSALAATSRVARATALLALGALALHQLRYGLAFGAGAGSALHREGHTYLVDLAPVLAALATAMAAGATLARGMGARARVAASTPRRALAYAASLIVVFSAQELVEGALAPGHPAGLAGVFGEGGWIALPLALALGAVAALVARLLDRAEECLGAAPRVRIRRRWPTTASLPGSLPDVPVLATRALAFGLARRGPPALPVP